MLFLLPWVILVPVRRHHLDTGSLVAVISVLAAASIGLPTLRLTWAALREAKRASARAAGVDIGQVANQLAIAVGKQWNDEAAIRRLNDPYPLPVSWAAADEALTDPWESLLKLATTGAGWPSRPPRGRWARGPADLGGKGDELREVLARVPTGRLVVLGEPGAGKTMLMVRLVLDLLAHRASGGPVPILASVASWNPVNQDLRDWLSAQLILDHPALATAPSADLDQPTQAAALLASGLILPVLDGLDEIPEHVCGPAIRRINDALRPGEQVVVTCRTRQYRDAVRPQEGVEVTLRAAAAIQLRPLDADAVRGYLCHDAAGPVTRARWAPVLAVLGTEAPTAQALRTPLMVGLARAVYNPRPGELAGTLRDPAELCSPALTDRTAVESLLFDAFILAAYRDSPAGCWKAQDAQRWLMFLARHLEHTITSPDLAWWQLPRAVRGFNRAAGGTAGAMAGIAVGLLVATGITPGLIRTIGAAVNGIVAGLLIASLVIFRAASRKPAPVLEIRWQPPGPLALGLGAAAAVASAAAVAIDAGAVTAAAVGYGIASGVAVTAVTSLFLQKGAPLDPTSATSPPAALAADRRTGAIAGAATAATTGVLAGLMASIVDGDGAILTTLLAVLAAAVAGAISCFEIAAWSAYVVARIWLALRDQLPWPLMDFLADAHRRGVLRQAGAVYQFRHIELQHRLATQDVSAVAPDTE
jgi:hypothetical protein